MNLMRKLKKALGILFTNTIKSCLTISFSNTKENKASNGLNKKSQPVQTNSNKEFQLLSVRISFSRNNFSQSNHKSSMKDFDNKSRSGIRKTVNLSKTHTRRNDDDDDDDEDVKEPVKVIQTKSKSTHSSLIKKLSLFINKEKEVLLMMTKLKKN